MKIARKNDSSFRRFVFSVVFRPEPEGGFTVTVPSLPGCVTYGKNLIQARRMAEEAISLYLEDMIAEGQPLPREDASYLANLEVKIPTRAAVYA